MSEYIKMSEQDLIDSVKAIVSSYAAGRVHEEHSPEFSMMIMEKCAASIIEMIEDTVDNVLGKSAGEAFIHLTNREVKLRKKLNGGM